VPIRHRLAARWAPNIRHRLAARWVPNIRRRNAERRIRRATSTAAHSAQRSRRRVTSTGAPGIRRATHSAAHSAQRILATVRNRVTCIPSWRRIRHRTRGFDSLVGSRAESNEAHAGRGLRAIVTGVTGSVRLVTGAA